MGDTVRVWDPLVRVLHWSLVLSVLLAWATAEESDTWHEWLGYAVMVIVALRLAWGLVGTRHARFSRFVKTPAQVLRYLGEMRRGNERRYLGHNPAGGAMIVALLLCLVVISASGWMMTADAYRHLEWLGELHELAGNLILLLAALHVGGVIFSGRRHGENLVRAMLTGYKRAPSPQDAS